MKKIGLRSLSVFLAVLMILFAFPLQVIAAELQNQTPDGDTAASGEAVTGTPIPGVDYEVTALREEYVKHFHLADGSYVAVSYDVPVHYADENGDWQDIDNRLADGGSDFTTRDARVKFAKKITGNGELFTIHDGNRKLSFSLVGAVKKTVGTVEDNGDPDTGTDTLQKWMELRHLSSSIIYRDILPGTDVEYLLDAGRMKENIIVREAAVEYRYVFELKLNHLSARSNEDGSISVTDPESGETVYYLPAPVVYDAAGAYSYDAVSYTLSEENGNRLTLTLEADPAWVNAPERVFPVTVDPTINGASGEFSDTYISEKPPKSVHGSADILRTGSTSSGGTNIIYWKQNQLPTLPKGAQVTDAKLSLYFKNSDGLISISDTELALGIYRVSEDWTESLNWYGYANNNNGKIAELQDFTVIDSLSSVGSYINWTISDLVRAWYGGTSNYGVAIKPISGTAMNLDFASSEAPGNRPRFAIQYKVINGLEDYWSYSSHSAANAGTGHINLATGELSFVFPTVSSGENLFGYQLGLVYNQSKINGADAPIANTLTDYRLTCQETITQFKYLSESGTEKTAYIWTDGDGTAHYLLPNTDASLYYDEDGLGLTLQKDDITSPSKLTDKNDTWRSFSADGYLTEIRDKIGNRVVFTYTTVNGYKSVSGINIYPAGSSKAISTLNLTYESSGVLKTVRNEKTSETVTFEYDGAGGISVSLDRITYSRVTNGQTYTRVYTVEYELGRRIKNVYDSHAQYGLSYTYDASGRVSEVTEIGGVKKAPGQSVGYTYGSGYTEIRTAGKDDKYGSADDLISHYTFDNQLRCVSQYTTNVDRNMIYGATRGRYEDASENRALENKLSESFVTGNTGINYLVNGGFELGSLNCWTTSGVTVSANTDSDQFIGEYCAKVTVDRSAHLLQYVQFTKGTYTLSLHIKSDIPDDVTVEACYPTPSGEDSRVAITKESSDSHYYTVTFEADGSFMGTVGLTFSKTGTGASTFYVDNVMLEKNLGSAGYNMVNCADFTVHTTKKFDPATWSVWDFWHEADLPDFALGYDDFNRDDPTFPNYLVIEGDAGLRGEFVQTIFSSDYGSARYKGCKFLVSGFGKADHISANKNSRFGLKMMVNYVANSDGTVPTPTEYYVPFDRGTSDWQFVSDVFTVAEKDGIQSITVSVVYDYQIGTAMFTDISVQLYSGNTNSAYAEQYKYNVYGDLIYKASGNDKYWYFYENVNGVSKLTKSVKNATDWLLYSYNDSDGTVQSVSSYYNEVDCVKHTYGEVRYQDIKDEVFSEKVQKTFTKDKWRYTSEYTYNTNGQCTSEKTSTSDGITQTSSTYVDTAFSAAYGSISTSTDERGKITRYYYDTATGNVSFAVAPDGTAKVYTYDGFGNLTGVNTALYNATKLTDTDLASVNYGYSDENGLLRTISTGKTQYTFSYNAFGRMEDISVGSTTLVDYILNDNNGKVSEMRYGNGASVRYVYDTLDRVSEVWYAESATADEVKVYTYAYDASGRLVRYTDHARNEQYTYLYTPTGLLYSTQISDLGEAHTYRTNWCRYDEENRIEERRYSFEFGAQRAASGLYTFTYSFGYYEQDENHLQDEYLNAVTASADGAGKQYHESIRRDDLMRLSGKTFNLRDAGNHSAFVTNQVTYTYLDGANGSTTGLVKSYQTLINGSGTTYNLTYDVNGNITSVSRGNYLLVRYAYDDLGQLVREDNREKNYTYYYTYDKAGNILYKEAFSLMMNGEDLSDKTPVYTNVYTYGNANWGDLLTSYKGHTITYDAIGNPLTYYGRTAYTFTWKNGRQLATATANGKTLSFTYNDQGMRLTKTVDGVTHTYSLDGDRIVAEEWGNQLLVYFYDDAGLPMGMMYRNSSYADKQFDYYLYEKDVFGNVLAIYNDSGTKVASYCYDAWGNCTVLTNVNGVGTMNPFRYRGYYLDTETNLYYLQTRYYDSYTGRFINADGTINGNGDLIGYNLFAYCSNNPVMYTDYSGEGWIRDFLEKAKNFLGKIFGAEYTASETVTIDKVDEFSQWSPVSYTVGVDGTVVVKQIGDSSKPISVYVDHDLLDFKKSTIGFKINIASFTFTYSLGLDNISISGSITDGDVTKSIGFRTNIVDLKCGIEVSTTTKMPDGFRKEYVNSSVNGQGLLLLALFLSGQPAPAPNPVYAH